jgi:hypothetical protein
VNPPTGTLVKPPLGDLASGAVGFTVLPSENPAGLIVFSSWNLGTDATGTVFPIPGAGMAGMAYEASMRLRSTAATADLSPGYRVEFTNVGYTHFGGMEVSTFDAANAPYHDNDFWATLLWEVPYGCNDMGDTGFLADWPLASTPTDYRDYTLLFDLFHNQNLDYGVFSLEEVLVQPIAVPTSVDSTFTYSNYSSWIGAFLNAADPFFGDGTFTPQASGVKAVTGTYDAQYGARFAGAFPPVSITPGNLAGNVACQSNRILSMSCTGISENIETTPITRLYMIPQMSAPVGTFGQPDYQGTRNITFFVMFGAVDPFAKLPAGWGGRLTSPSQQPNPGVPPAGAGTALTLWVDTHAGYDETNDYFLPNLQVLSLNRYPPTGGTAPYTSGSGWQDDSGGTTFNDVTITYYN